MLRACLVCNVAVAILVSLSSSSRAERPESLTAGAVQKVVGDCKFTEGPAWHPQGFLLFTDIPNSRIIRVNTDGTSSDWMKPSGGANGVVCDQAGSVYICQGAEQRVARVVAGPDQTAKIAAVLADRFGGERFNQPNDLAIDSDGGLYFTDPNYRREPLSQPVEGVYYVGKEGEVSLVIGDLPRPNGILVSPDGKTLYVANIELSQIVAYPIVAPGQLSTGKVLFTGDAKLDGKGPDGMALDEKGNIYATYSTVVVISPEGALKERIEVPEHPANCTFGGADLSTLFITARTSLYKIPMKVKGLALPVKGPQGSESVASTAKGLPKESFVSKDDDGSDCDDAAAPKVRSVKLQDLTLKVPAAWAEQKPTSSLRLGQFSIPAVEGDAEPTEYVVFPPFGGSINQNLERWIQQFEAEGRSVKLTQGTVPQGKYVLVELSGTYKRPFGPPFAQQTKPAPNFAMIGIILTAESGGNYFIKVTGPRKTLEASAKDVRATIEASAEKEKPYEPADE